LTEKPADYPWSSYLDYIGKRQAPCWLRLDAVKAHFGANEKYRRFVEDMLGKDYESPLQGTVASTLLGSESYVRHIMETHLDGKPLERDVPAIRELSKSRKIEQILNGVKGVFGDAGLERKIGIYLAHRYTGAQLKEIGTYFDKTESAISQASRRFAAEMAGDKELEKVVNEVVEKLNLS
jgi:hypothetical protein